MTLTEEQVEWIVLEVIRRLQGMEAGRAAAAEPRSSGMAGSQGELKLNDKVITWRLLDGRLANVSRVVVRRRAVVTPMVRDELKARRIELICDGER